VSPSIHLAGSSAPVEDKIKWLNMIFLVLCVSTIIDWGIIPGQVAGLKLD
jgi:hypothetical protein